MKVTGNEEIGNNGHRKARAQEAQNVLSSTMTKVEEREKQTSDCGRQVQQKGGPLRNQKSVTGLAQAREEKKVDFFVSVARRTAVFKINHNASTGILRSAFFTNKDNADQVRPKALKLHKELYKKTGLSQTCVEQDSSKAALPSKKRKHPCPNRSSSRRTGGEVQSLRSKENPYDRPIFTWRSKPREASCVPQKRRGFTSRSSALTRM